MKNKISFLGLGLFLAMLPIFSALAQEKVFVMEIRDAIDPRMSRYVTLALEAATEQQADYVVVDMDTYGGAVNDADLIRSAMLDYEKPIFVFINKNAASAGALISIACDSIYMQKGANIGAATVVNGGDGSKAPDKYQSYMRSMMRSTAEAQGRDPQVAEAMVDADVAIEGITKEGKVLTFSASEALANDFCDGVANSIEEILALNNIEDYTLVRYEKSLSEQIIAFFLNPAISGVLILIILGGIYFELQSPGIGFPLVAGILAAILYFVPYYLNGLAEYWEVIAFGVGIALLAAEIFVIPGFGIAGISGIIVSLGALGLMMLNNDWFDFTFVGFEQIQKALTTVFAAAFAAILMMLFGAARLGNTQMMKRVALQTTFKKEEGYSSKSPSRSLISITGTAYTVLRPSGKVLIDGEVYDAYTRGEYLEKGEEIIVVSDEGNSLKVKKMESPEEIL